MTLQELRGCLKILNSKEIKRKNYFELILAFYFVYQMYLTRLKYIILDQNKLKSNRVVLEE